MCQALGEALPVHSAGGASLPAFMDEEPSAPRGEGLALCHMAGVQMPHQPWPLSLLALPPHSMRLLVLF